MTEQRRKIDNALRQEWWRSFVADAKRSWWGLSLTIFVLLTLCVGFGSPISIGETVHGTTIGAHQLQSETGQGALMATVRLDETDEIVSVSVPVTLPYRSGAQIEMRERRRDWFPRLATYEYVRYSEEAPPISEPRSN